MDYALIGLALILLIIIVTHIVNDKTLKLPTDILLVGVAFVIGLVARILCTTIFTGNPFYEYFLNFDFNTFLMDGILCFLVFVGSSKINFNKFVHNIKNITILSILTTVFTTFIYGGLFYLLNLCLSLNFTIWMCFILGAVIAPTDPIAATSILNKIGLSKNVTSIFEGESLFNDGVGIALFLCFKGMVEKSGEANFVLILVEEILGGILVGLVLCVIMWFILKRCKNPIIHILISLFVVATSYAACEAISELTIVSFSGVIACVVDGIFFSYMFSKNEEWRKVVDPQEIYQSFWNVIDSVLNSILFVMVGFCVIYVPFEISVAWFILLLVPIVISLTARFSGIYLSSFAMGRRMPGGYSKLEFSGLLTWGGLRGALSMALALSCKSFLPTDAYQILILVTFSTIMFSILFQGLTIKKAYKIVESSKIKREDKLLSISSQDKSIS